MTDKAEIIRDGNVVDIITYSDRREEHPQIARRELGNEPTHLQTRDSEWTTERGHRAISSTWIRKGSKL